MVSNVNKARKKVRWGAFGLLVIMGFYVASLRVEGVRESIYNAGSWCVACGVKLQQYVAAPLENVFNYGMSVRVLRERIDHLQQERDSLMEERIRKEGLAAFSQETEELRSYAQRYEHECSLLLAQVMIKEFSPEQQVFTVDKGARHGVTPSMVAVYKNMLIGRVSEVRDWYSKITLVTDRLCKVSAYCVKTRAAGIVEGVNTSDELRLVYISHLSSVEEGDEVFSSGHGMIFPRGFALGTISHCELEGLYYKVVIKPCIDMATIDFCYLLEKADVSGVDLSADADETHDA